MTSTILQPPTTTSTTTTESSNMGWSHDKLRFSCVDNIGLKQLWKLIALDTNNTTTAAAATTTRTTVTSPNTTTTNTVTQTDKKNSNNKSCTNNNNNNNVNISFENCENINDYLGQRDFDAPSRMSLLKFLAINALELSAPATPVLLQQQQQQQQQLLHTHLDLATTQNLNEETRLITNVNINNETELPLSSSNNDNDNENEKPEEDTNWRQSVINNCNNSANQTPRCNNPNNSTVNNTPITKNVTKKRKNLRKQSLNQSNVPVNNANSNETNEEEGNENLRGACSLAAQQHQKLQQENKDKQNENKNDTNVSSSTNSPKSAASGTTTAAIAAQQHHSTECDLIKYIINRIRNQTHTNTLINDALLVDVAKLTATVAQNAQPLTHNINLGNNASNISPKKIYAKIKKLSLPKERDEFLRWYQKYLENTLFGNQQQQQQQRQQQQSSDKGKSTTKSTNNQQQQQNDLPPANTDDGDLAEADQNCSLNNSGSGGIVNNTVSSTYHQSEAPALILIKTETSNNGIEYENNENPDEAHSLNIENNRENTNSKNATELTNDLINSETPLMNLKGHEAVTNPNEKSDLKCEKPEFTEKE